MEHMKIAKRINSDIDHGVYDNFDKLKSRLQYISNKLSVIAYIQNKEGLSDSELRTLEENDYI